MRKSCGLGWKHLAPAMEGDRREELGFAARLQLVVGRKRQRAYISLVMILVTSSAVTEHGLVVRQMSLSVCSAMTAASAMT